MPNRCQPLSHATRARCTSLGCRCGKEESGVGKVLDQRVEAQARASGPRIRPLCQELPALGMGAAHTVACRLAQLPVHAAQPLKVCGEEDVRPARRRQQVAVVILGKGKNSRARWIPMRRRGDRQSPSPLELTLAKPRSVALTSGAFSPGIRVSGKKSKSASSSEWFGRDRWSARRKEKHPVGRKQTLRLQIWPASVAGWKRGRAFQQRRTHLLREEEGSGDESPKSRKALAQSATRGSASCRCSCLGTGWPFTGCTQVSVAWVPGPTSTRSCGMLSSTSHPSTVQGASSRGPHPSSAPASRTWGRDRRRTSKTPRDVQD